MTEDVAPKIDTAVLVPIENLEENDWNPNFQSEVTFNQLVDEINTDGFQDPLLVVPVEDGKVDPKTDRFRIIGGAHRYRAAKLLEYEEVPCFIMEGWTEEEQKLKTVRRNLISGRLDDAKFTDLVKSLVDTGLNQDDLPLLMGFDDVNDFTEHLILEAAEEESDEKVLSKMEETSTEVEAVDSISDALNNIFATYGDTVPQNFLFFAYKGKTHLMVIMDAELNTRIEKMVEELKVSKGNVNDYFKELFKKIDEMKEEKE